MTNRETLRQQLGRYKYMFTSISPLPEVLEKLRKPNLDATVQQRFLKMLIGWRMAEIITARNPRVLGIGSGTTSQAVVCALGQLPPRDASAPPMEAISTSESLGVLANYHGISTQPFDQTLQTIKEIREDSTKLTKKIDLGFDGADELMIVVDENDNIIEFPSIKGGGGAHTIERINAQMANELVFVVDETKIVSYLGEKFYLPIEVTPEGLEAVRKKLVEAYGFDHIDVKKDLKNPDLDFVTDLGNRVLMAYPKKGEAMPTNLENMPQHEKEVLDAGLFINTQPQTVLVACSDGSVASLKIGDHIDKNHRFYSKIVRKKQMRTA